ncbi:hypothetical protein ACIBVL_19745 [Streptomyces sp. NPDC049687]|uniref:hypothetical protein n=1 Tax=Streptomyces sp. NPDC049687 TaxID=3365596 RepID=UPI0037B01B9D
MTPALSAGDGNSLSLLKAVPKVDPSLAKTVEELRSDLPRGDLVGGAAVENLDIRCSHS